MLIPFLASKFIQGLEIFHFLYHHIDKVTIQLSCTKFNLFQQPDLVHKLPLISLLVTVFP